MTTRRPLKTTAVNAGVEVEPAASLTVDVQYACSDAAVPATGDIKAWVSRAVANSGRSPQADVEVSVRIVDSDEIRTLNALYRRQDKATNVLAFPTGAIDGLPDSAAAHLGDIVVCAAVVRDEARAQGKVLEDHWAHMLVHGTLHLLGFDHEAELQAAKMEGLEALILAQCGISNPYASRP